MDKQENLIHRLTSLGSAFVSMPVANGTIEQTEEAGELMIAAAKALTALACEAYTWSKAAEHYAKPLQPLDPLDVEELWDAANADPYADEVHHEFARLLQRKLGIGG